MAFGGAGAGHLVVAAASRKSENLLLPEEFSRTITAKVAGLEGRRVWRYC